MVVVVVVAGRELEFCKPGRTDLLYLPVVGKWIACNLLELTKNNKKVVLFFYLLSLFQLNNFCNIWENLWFYMNDYKWIMKTQNFLGLAGWLQKIMLQTIICFLIVICLKLMDKLNIMRFFKVSNFSDLLLLLLFSIRMKEMNLFQEISSKYWWCYYYLLFQHKQTQEREKLGLSFEESNIGLWSPQR